MKQFFQYLVYLGFRILIKGIRWIPEKLLFLGSNILAYILQKVVGYRKAVIHKNIANSFPRRTAQEKEQIASDYYLHLSDLLLETLRAFCLPKTQLAIRFEYQNTDVLLPYLENQQSILLLGSHYGNWEMGCLSFPLQLPFPTYTVYKPLSNPYLNPYLKKLRGRWGMHMIAMNKIGRVLIENKAQPAVYIFVADQSPASTEQAIWKTFLHQDTPFINGVEKIARRTKYPVFYFAIKKCKRGYYTVTFSKIQDGELPLKEGQLTDAYLDKLTEQIIEVPHQWLWSHNRWKRARK